MSNTLNNEPLVGIVLVNFNGMKFLPDCIKSLSAVGYKNRRIVLVDNASKDGSLEWAKKNSAEFILVPLETNVGIAAGNNVGIRKCLEINCDYILLLNNDTVVKPDFLEKLMVHAGPNTLVAPKIYYFDNPSLINNHFGSFCMWRGRHLDTFFNQTDTDASQKVQFGNMANTCALLFHRSVVDKIGMMDEDLWMYFDDTDFIYRAVSALQAKAVFSPEAVIFHKESSTSGGTLSPLTTYYCTRNRLYFMGKHQHSLIKKVYFLAYFLAGRLSHIVANILKRRKGVNKAILAGTRDWLMGIKGFVQPTRYK